MSTKKPTQKEMFLLLLTLNDVKKNNELVEFINGRIEMLDKKNVKDGELTPTQQQNLKLKVEIVQVLSEQAEPIQAKEIASLLSASKGENITTQKIVPQLKKLVEEGKIFKDEKNKYEI